MNNIKPASILLGQAEHKPGKPLKWEIANSRIQESNKNGRG